MCYQRISRVSSTPYRRYHFLAGGVNNITTIQIIQHSIIHLSDPGLLIKSECPTLQKTGFRCTQSPLPSTLPHSSTPYPGYPSSPLAASRFAPSHDECHTLYDHHHGLLDDLSSDLSVQHHRMLDLLCSVLLHLLLNHGYNIAVHVRGALRDTEVDLLYTLGVSAKGGVASETIACAVLWTGKLDSYA